MLIVTDLFLILAFNPAVVKVKHLCLIYMAILDGFWIYFGCLPQTFVNLC